MALQSIFLSFVLLWSLVAAVPHVPRIFEWQKWTLLDSHNEARLLHGSPPLTWSDSLASAAQSWVSLCEMKHFNGGFRAGENLAVGTFSSVSQAVDMFIADKDKYNPDDPSYRRWTQVVWKASTEVGCGVVTCPNLLDGQPDARLVGCLYNPPGNVMGQISANV